MTTIFALFLLAFCAFPQNTNDDSSSDPQYDPNFELLLDMAKYPDARRQSDILPNGTESELTPVELATFLLEHDSWEYQVIQKVRPYMVDVIVNNQSYTGVIVGFSERNQPLILSSAQAVYYNPVEDNLWKTEAVEVNDPHQAIQESLLVPKSQTILRVPSLESTHSLTSHNERITAWHGIPVYHPLFFIDKGRVNYHADDNFSILMMVNRSESREFVDVGSTKSADMSRHMYTLDNSLRARFPLATRLPQLPVAAPQGDAKALIMGRAIHLFSSSQTNSRGIRESMSYAVVHVLDGERSARWAAKQSETLDPEKQFVVDGEVDLGMMGAGIFNNNGELLGVVSKIFRNDSHARNPRHRFLDHLDRRIVQLNGAIVIRADYLQREMAQKIRNNSYLDGVFGQTSTDVVPLFKSCLEIF